MKPKKPKIVSITPLLTDSRKGYNGYTAVTKPYVLLPYSIFKGRDELHAYSRLQQFLDTGQWPEWRE